MFTRAGPTGAHTCSPACCFEGGDKARQDAAAQNTGSQLPACGAAGTAGAPIYIRSFNPKTGAILVPISEGDTEARSVRSDLIQGLSGDWNPGSATPESVFQPVLCGFYLLRAPTFKH